jgi:hypothetical protein
MTAEQVLDELTNDEYLSLPRLGWVFTYNVSKEVEKLTKEQVTEILERNGYDPDSFNHITPQKAYHIAKLRMQTTDANANPKILLRPIGTKTGSLIRHQVTSENIITVQSGKNDVEGLEHGRNLFITFDKEKQERGEHPLSFTKEGNERMSVENKKFALDFEAEYNRVLKHLLANDLYNWIWKQKNNWQTVSWRTTGGMFFAPNQYTPQIEQMHRCITEFDNGCIFKRLPILNFPEHRADITESFDRDMEARIAALNEDLEDLIKRGRSDGTLPEKLLKDRLRKYEGVLNEAKMYGTLLSHRSDLVDNALGVIRTKVEQVLAGTFKGVKAEIGKMEQRQIDRDKRKAARDAARAAKAEDKAQKKKDDPLSPANAMASFLTDLPKGYKFDKPAEITAIKAYAKEIGRYPSALNIAQKVTAICTPTTEETPF